VIRRTIATLAQKKGTVKDVQGLMRHSRTATTTDVYMQEIPESVQATVNAINLELRKSEAAGKRKKGGERSPKNCAPKRGQLAWKRSGDLAAASANLTQIDTKSERGVAANC